MTKLITGPVFESVRVSKRHYPVDEVISGQSAEIPLLVEFPMTNKQNLCTDGNCPRIYLQ